MSAGWIDELEAELGQAARLRLIANLGGQRQTIPSLSRAGNSVLAGAVGSDIARWLARRFAGTKLEIPSRRGSEIRRAAALLAADIIEAGLDHPTRTNNDLASAHGVTVRYIIMRRQELRRDRDAAQQLSLFPEELPPAQPRR